jgi:hypothetical protein
MSVFPSSVFWSLTTLFSPLFSNSVQYYQFVCVNFYSDITVNLGDSLITTGTSNLVSCSCVNNNSILREKHNNDNWKQQCPTDNSFSAVDNKWYFVIWHAYEFSNWSIIKFKNGVKEHWPRGLRSLTCWDRRFESYRGHGCLSVVSVVSYQVEVSATSWSLVQSRPTDCGASLCVI